MRLLLTALVALGAFGAPSIPSTPLRRGVLLASLILGISLIVHGVITRRKRGQSWNEALANGEKLMTGSVWIDGLLFAAILVVICVSVFLLFFYA
jgi:uncharacterized membrane protein YidH (DUF202 family)